MNRDRRNTFITPDPEHSYPANQLSTLASLSFIILDIHDFKEQMFNAGFRDFREKSLLTRLWAQANSGKQEKW